MERETSPAAAAHLLAVLFGTALLGWATPAQAQTVETLVSNTGQTSTGSNQLFLESYAQSFTTGGNSGGYTLSEVVIKVHTVSSSTVTAGIYETTSGVPSSTLVVALSGNFSATGDRTFTPATTTTLDASTTYAVVIGSSSGGRLSTTSSNDEDSGAASGWSIANEGYRDALGTGWSGHGTNFQIAIRGYANSAGTDTNNAPTVANAIADQEATVNEAFTFTFPATTFADADTGDTLTYTATLADSTALPSWLTFTPDTRTFMGTPTTAGTLTVRVTATDGAAASIYDEFDIVVTAAFVCTVPELTGRDVHWTATLTAAANPTQPLESGYEVAIGVHRFGTLSPTTFTIGTTQFTVGRLSHLGPTLIAFNINPDLAAEQVAVATLHICDTELAFSSASALSNNLYQFGVTGGPLFSAGNQVTVRLSTPTPNTPATGAPAITGTPQVGQTLTAGQGTIADADGLPATFPDDYTFQWIRVDGSDETNLPSATSQTYMPVAADVGTTLKVKVSFTDNAGHDEARTSVATAAVTAAPNTPATGAPAITGTPQVGQTLTAGQGTIADADGLPATFPDDYTFQWIRVDGSDETNLPSATSQTYMPVAADVGTTLKVKVSFTDNAGHDEARTSVATAAVTAAPNTPATGAPAITGTPQVGQTLTAGQGTIADADGLPATFPDDYTFQWIRVDGSDETNLPSATSQTYMPVAADVGTTLKVKVSFTDNAGHDEARTSVATAAVTAAPNTPATGAPAITGTPQVGQTLTAGQGTIADADGLPATFPDDYTFQWIRVDGSDETNLPSATSQTYMPVAADVGTTLKVKVSFTDNAGHDEARTSVATAAVTAAPNTPATGAPAITGTPQVGQTLTAGQGTIADADGLPATFPDDYTFQWIRVDGSDETNLPSATSQTYMPVAADVGTTLKVKVSFTDNAGHAEARTSVATAAVIAADTTAPTVVITDVPDTSISYFMATFTFSEPVEKFGLDGITVTNGTASNFTGSDGDTVYTARITPTAAGRVTVNVDAGAAEDEADNLSAAGTAARSFYSPAASDMLISNIGQSSDNVADLNTYDVAQGFTTGDHANGYRLTSVEVVFRKVVQVFAYSVGIWSSDEEVDASRDSDSLHEPHTSLGTLTCPTLTVSTDAAVYECTTTGIDLDADTTYLFVVDVTIVAANHLRTTGSTAEDSGGASGWSIADNYVYRSSGSGGAWLSWPAGRIKIRVNGATRANSPATGAPAITGTAQVGQMLTAGIGDIADANGLPATFPDDYTFQWIRVDGSTETNLPSATSHTYMPVAADVGTTLKVRVSFTDNAGNAEARTSAATAAVIAAPTTCPAPTFGTRRHIWTGNVTVGAVSSPFVGVIERGFNASLNVGALDDTDFTISVAYTIDSITVDAAGGSDDGNLEFNLASNLTATEQAALKLHVCDTAYDFSAATGPGTASNYEWEATLDWSTETMRTLYLSLPANNAATGTPTITSSGTANAGDVLTADPAGITDADGKPATFEYQWVREDADGMNPADITGETSSTYTLAAADVGQRVRVRVEFVDLLGSEESVESAAWPASGTVAAAGTACPAPDFGTRRQIWTGNVTVGLDTPEYGYFINSYGALDDTTFAIGANNYTIRFIRVGEGRLRFLIAKSGGGGLTGVGVAALSLHVCNTPYDFSDAVVNDLDTIFSWSTSLDWSGETMRTLYLSLPANRAATGTPTITSSGTAVSGDTLTADPAGIADPDGLPDTVTYQWIREDADGSNPAPIAGETSATYTLTNNDVGKRVRVRVGFTDQLGSAETRASGPWPLSGAVAEDPANPVRPNTPASGAPTIAGPAGGSAPRVGQTLTADLSAIEDADGLPPAAGFSYQWIREDTDGTNREDIPGANGPSYTLAPGDAGKVVSVRVTFTDAGGRVETVTSAPTAVVAARTVADDALPELVADARTVTMTYDEALDPAAVPAPGDFEVRITYVDGSNRVRTLLACLADVRVAGSTVTLTLANRLHHEDRVRVSYTPGAVPVRYAAGGGAAPAFADAAAENRTPDIEPPKVRPWDQVTVNGATLRITFPEPLDPGSVPAPAGFEVNTSFNVHRHEGILVERVSVSGRTVTLTLARAVGGEESVSVRYALRGGTPIRDLAGNPSWTGGQFGADNRTQSGAEQGKTLTADGDTVTVVFDAALDAAPALGLHDFKVKKTFTSRHGSYGKKLTTVTLLAHIRTVAVRGSTVTLTLYNRIDHDMIVRLSYVPSGPPLRFGGGRAVAAFSNLPVANRTVGPGSAQAAAAPPTREEAAPRAAPPSGPPLTATLTARNGEHGGDPGVREAVSLRFSEAPAGLGASALGARVSVAGGTLDAVTGSGATFTIWFRPAGVGPVTVRLSAAGGCGGSGSICTADGRALSAAAAVAIPGPIVISVADAEVREAPGATLDFVVSLSRPVPAGRLLLLVGFRTQDGTATASEDYRALRGRTYIKPGETSTTISIGVVDDAHDEGAETMTLTLSHPSTGRIGDGTATGTIKNDDPLQRAWLARFGRTVGTHVTDAVGARLRGAPGQGAHLTVGGYRLPLGRDATDPSAEPGSRGGRGKREGEPRARAAKLWGPVTPDASPAPPGRLTTVLTEVARVLGMSPDPATPDAPWLDGPGPDPRLGRSRTLDVGQTFTLRRVLLGSSFRLNLNAADSSSAPRLTAWGGVAGTAFNGRDGVLAVDGDVLTGTVGVDGEWDRWLAGVAVAHSRGDGAFASAGLAERGQGDLEQTLTSLHPYLRYAVTDQLDVWGLLGYGWGELDLEIDNATTIETDTQLVMGAFGGRGVLLSAAESGGLQLATRTDAMLTRTRTDAVANSAATAADAHRLRVILEGSRGVTWEDGRRFTPTVEVGLRHDWGDAETGVGVELGGRVQYADPALGLTLEGAVRGLLAHEDGDYQEWGASGTVQLAPGPAGRGLSVTLAPTWGAATSGVERLWARQTTAGLASSGSPRAPAGRLAADVGYGLPAPFGRGLLTPYAGTVLAEGAARTYRVGTRLEMPRVGATGVTLRLEGQRQESAGPQPVTQGLRLQVDWQF